jgi:hypothetical protein
MQNRSQSFNHVFCRLRRFESSESRSLLAVLDFLPCFRELVEASIGRSATNSSPSIPPTPSSSSAHVSHSWSNSCSSTCTPRPQSPKASLFFASRQDNCCVKSCHVKDSPHLVQLPQNTTMRHITMLIRRVPWGCSRVDFYRLVSDFIDLKFFFSLSRLGLWPVCGESANCEMQQT